MALQRLLFLIAILPLFTAEVALRHGYQHKLNGKHIASQFFQKNNRVPLQRDDSISKKLNIYNLISKAQSLLKDEIGFIQLNFDHKSGQITEQMIEHTKEDTSLIQTSTHQNSKVDIKNQMNSFFTGNIGVGSKDEKYKMIFDSGSTLIFLNSVMCNDIGCTKGTQYDKDNSSTYEEVDMRIEVEYGTGTLQGDMSKDTFFVGGMQVDNVQFLEITKQKGGVFKDGNFDGLVGLSFPELGEGFDTLVDYMKDSNSISKKQFSMYLSREEMTTDSFISFGEIDKSVIDGEIQYHKVASPLYWTILAEQIKFGNEDTGLCSKEAPCALAVDSGTSIIAGPSKQTKKLIKLIDSQNYSCGEISEMPPISFVIDGIEYPLYGDEYMMSTTTTLSYMYKHSKDAKSCKPAFMTLNIQEPNLGDLWVLGDIFLTKYYTVYDREEQRVGLGKLKSIDQKYYFIQDGSEQISA